MKATKPYQPLGKDNKPIVVQIGTGIYQLSQVAKMEKGKFKQDLDFLTSEFDVRFLTEVQK